jgi:hypothetical protein
MVGILPITGALVIAFEMPYDSALYVGISLLLAGASIGWSIASIPQDQRTALSRRLLSRTPPVNSTVSQEKHGS